VDQLILYVAVGAFLGAAGLFLSLAGLQRRATYTGLTIDDMIDSFRQVNQEVLQERLLEMDEESAVEPHHGWTSYSYRRHLRVGLDLLKDYVERMLHNSSRVGYWAGVDEREMRKHKLEYTPQSLKALRELVEADGEVRRLGRSVLWKAWLWSLSGFEKRTWGPVPDIAKFQIPRLLEAYNRVKRAAEAYALFYGETGRLISQEIAIKM